MLDHMGLAWSRKIFLKRSRDIFAEICGDSLGGVPKWQEAFLQSPFDYIQ
jgi:hypothetical protein